MPLARPYCAQQPTFFEDYRPPFGRINRNGRSNSGVDLCGNQNSTSNNLHINGNYNTNTHLSSRECGEKDYNFNNVNVDNVPSLKKRKLSASGWENCSKNYQPPNIYDAASSTCHNYALRPNSNTYTSTTGKRGRSKLDDDDVDFMSKDEIERHSPSRKDGIDALRETHLRYSYCGFVQNLGLRLELPQTTIGTAMVLCHRFFVRRSHAFHDRFLIATAALFLAAKSEETARPLTDVLRASCEIIHRQDFNLLSYLLPIDWFEKYRERVLDAEQVILTTLNFELNVHHPYGALTTIFDKLGLSQTALVHLALSLISEGLRSSLWLQFKPHHIAAGAAYLAAKFLNMDLTSYHHIWQEFQTTPVIIQDVAQQLMELFYV